MYIYIFLIVQLLECLIIQMHDEILKNRVFIDTLTGSIGGHPVDVTDANNSTLPESINLPIDSMQTLLEVDDLMKAVDMRRRMVCKYR